MTTKEIITFCDLRRQSLKLLCWRLWRILRSSQLPLANRMHDFDPSDRTARRPERLEAQHRPYLAFHRAMVLFHDIVEIFALPDSDACLVSLVIMRNRRGIT